MGGSITDLTNDVNRCRMLDMNNMNTTEYFEILRELDTRHGVFYHLWDMGNPVFTDSVPTAGVRLDDNGECLEFLLNKDFWDSQNLEQKIFILCHECMHVALNHGYRLFKNAKDNRDFIKMNLATDVVINHTLVNKFKMDRGVIDPDNKYCWLDTVFTEEDNVKPGKSSDYYYNRITNKKADESSASTVDDHSCMGNGDESDSTDGGDEPSNMEDILKELDERLGDEEKDFLNEAIEKNEALDNKKGDGGSKEAGSSPGNIFHQVDTRKVKKKRKWESVIKKWANQFLVEKDKDELQWARTNRRMHLISPDLFLPSEMEVEEVETEKKRIEVWFFQDTSGSCSGYRQRFFDAAKSLPEDKFDIKMHCFDTRVYETTTESGKLYGFGGTTFDCIERYILKHTKDGEYPKAVFIITDGYGNTVLPKVPQNWYWFITPGGSTSYVHNKSHKFDLADYE